MQRVNVRVRYPIDEVTSATACLIEGIADAHKGIWWCGGNLSDVTAESNFAFGSRESAFGFMLRVNCLKFAYAFIDFEQTSEVGKEEISDVDDWEEETDLPF